MYTSYRWKFACLLRFTYGKYILHYIRKQWPIVLFNCPSFDERQIVFEGITVLRGFVLYGGSKCTKIQTEMVTGLNHLSIFLDVKE